MLKPVLLIYPPYEGKSLLRTRSPFPIGLLYIASYLAEIGVRAVVKDFGYPPDRVSVERPRAMRVKQQYSRFGWRDDDIRDWLYGHLHNYHSVVGVASLMSSTYNGGYRVVDIIKEIDSERTVVMGGPHATAFPEHVAKYSKADFICIGEGEQSFSAFLAGITDSGVYSRDAVLTGAVVPRRRFIQDLNVLPFPDRRLLDDYRDINDMIVTFSRGCPHKCSFCGSHLIQGRMWRHKSVDTAIKELSFYNSHWGVRSFLIEDDNLCPGEKGIKWLKRLCKRIVDELPSMRFHVPHGIPVYATADKELCDLLWSAGFRRMAFPLESTDRAVLKDMQKEFTPNNWRKAIKNWSYETEHPTEIILGYPFVETIETMLTTMLDIADERAVIWASHFRLNKGTLLFDRCLSAGYVGSTYDPINTQNFYIETERFTVGDLKELMQISKGLNFASENRSKLFSKEVVDSVVMRKFKSKPRVGETVATGKFKFKRSQNIYAVLKLFMSGWWEQSRPIVGFGTSGDSLVYKGERYSRVYSSLHRLLVKRKVLLRKKGAGRVWW